MTFPKACGLFFADVHHEQCGHDAHGMARNNEGDQGDVGETPPLLTGFPCA
jgi:hypothetical protein